MSVRSFSRRSKIVRQSRRRLGFERLEDRQLLSATTQNAIDLTANLALGGAGGEPTVVLRQMEYLDRGLVAVRTGSSTAYVGWRLLGTDPGDIAFNLYRSSGDAPAEKLNALPLTASTNFNDSASTGLDLNVASSYFVRPVINGVEQEASESFVLAAASPTQQYLSVPLDIPPGGVTPTGESYTYSANDASVGDVDGDGQYEIILKWDPSNSKDNSQSGYTGNVYVDAYKLDGTRLWRIDLGRNIRAGAHYTQFMVYDFDGDGKAEVAMKTAPGTVDGLGHDVLLPRSGAGADYRNSSGYVLTGAEYLTIFNGETGAELATVDFQPARAAVSQWGDSYGNRVDRFTSGIAYLDGVHPSLIVGRGYYGPQSGSGQARNEIAAYDFRDGQLTLRWIFKAGLNINDNINVDYIGQGAHSLTIGDVDGDGKDEIVYGAAVIDDDGTGLYSTGLGHGDALHLSDFDPTRPGLEVFMVHESVSEYQSQGRNAGGEFRDAATGALIYQIPATSDVGRGVAADIWAGTPGAEAWASGGGATNSLFASNGTVVGRRPGTSNFLVWWDADLVRELFDGQSSGTGTPRIDKYGLSSDTRLLNLTGTATSNTTKSNPALIADILGDWREEVIVKTTDSSALRIYTTTNLATNRLYTLMHDTQYRESIAAQNSAYNQPSHPSFFLGAGMAPPPVPQIYTVQFVPGLPGLPGDYNDDQVVNAADYSVWRNNLGTEIVLPNDSTPGTVTEEDYFVWKANFGAIHLAGGQASVARASGIYSQLAPTASEQGTAATATVDSAFAALALPAELPTSSIRSVSRTPGHRAQQSIGTPSTQPLLLLARARAALAVGRAGATSLESTAGKELDRSVSLDAVALSDLWNEGDF